MTPKLYAFCLSTSCPTNGLLTVPQTHLAHSHLWTFLPGVCHIFYVTDLPLSHLLMAFYFRSFRSLLKFYLFRKAFPNFLPNIPCYLILFFFMALTLQDLLLNLFGISLSHQNEDLLGQGLRLGHNSKPAFRIVTSPLQVLNKYSMNEWMKSMCSKPQSHRISV